MAVAVVGIALVGVGSLLGFGRRSELPGLPKGEAPVIAAKPGAVKERPANPGGAEVPNQDKAIFQQRQDPARGAERVAPREEQPVDLTQAQRSVRQIPGVPVVVTPTVPVPATPVAGASAPAAPAEPPPAATAPPVRQVQGVPIVLAAPVPAAPVPAATPPSPPPVAAPPASVQPAAPPAAEPPARVEAAQPRRVQSVPVRGEGDPSRTRPAQTARRPAEPAANADPNAPLSITPPALRGTSTPQRVAAAPPAATASAPPRVQNDASPGGGGFAVQLAAEGSEEAAQARFTRMQGQFAGALAGQSPSVRRAEVGGRSVYRLRVGNMSREEAVALCERLKSAGGSCFVARN
jgi:hypothetical protein